MVDERIVRTFGFVDLAGFTALTETHGDVEAADLAGRFVELTEQTLGPDDRLVKSIGDAVLLSAPEPADALGLLRRLFEALFATPAFPVPRAGLHHGPAIERGGDVFGAAVNLTARVAAQAFGGQVLGTAVVADAARDLDARVVDLGTFALRNVAEPVQLFEIGVHPLPKGGAVDPVCRMHVERAAAAGRLRFGDTDYWFCSLTCAAMFAGGPERYIGT